MHMTCVSPDAALGELLEATAQLPLVHFCAAERLSPQTLPPASSAQEFLRYLALQLSAATQLQSSTGICHVCNMVHVLCALLPPQLHGMSMPGSRVILPKCLNSVSQKCSEMLTSSTAPANSAFILLLLRKFVS